MNDSTDGIEILNSCVHNILFPFLTSCQSTTWVNIFSEIIPLQLSKDFSGAPGILTQGKTLHA